MTMGFFSARDHDDRSRVEQRSRQQGTRYRQIITAKLYHTILTHHYAWHCSLATDKYNATALVSIEFCDVLQILQHVHIFLPSLLMLSKIKIGGLPLFAFL